MLIEVRKIVDGVICLVSEFPASAIKIVFNGTAYVIYEDGDELPPEFNLNLE